MSIDRREMCLLLPALLPIATSLGFAQESSLPSGAFAFEKAPLHIANNNAQIRLQMRGKLAIPALYFVEAVGPGAELQK